MIELSIEQCRPYLLGILKHIDSFCRDNGINYSLGYGSLIGAIRHHGFIPWDDDIDIIMTRENYDRFIELYQAKTSGQERYRIRKGKEIANHLHAVVSDEKTRVIFEKGTSDDKFYKGGVWVDLFPLDNCMDEKSYEQKWKMIHCLRKVQFLAEVGSEPMIITWRQVFKTVLRPFLYPFSGIMSFFLNRLMTSENGCDTEFFASYSVWYWKQKAIPKRLFDKYIEVDFEGGKYYAMNGFDMYLRNLYEDYMQFPPENERFPKHNYKAYAY